MNCVVEILVPHTTRLNLAPLVYNNSRNASWKIEMKNGPSLVYIILCQDVTFILFTKDLN